MYEYMEICWLSCAHFREGSLLSDFGIACRKCLVGLPNARNRPPAPNHSHADISYVGLLLLFA